MIKKIISALGLILVMLLFTLPSQVFAVPVADWSISDTYMADNVIWIGAGDPNSPLWETLIQSHQWTPSGTVDISGGTPYLWGNQWYLKVADEWLLDSGSIVNFDIRPGVWQYLCFARSSRHMGWSYFICIYSDAWK